MWMDFVLGWAMGVGSINGKKTAEGFKVTMMIALAS
jgi:hypothetical protein